MGSGIHAVTLRSVRAESLSSWVAQAIASLLVFGSAASQDLPAVHSSSMINGVEVQVGEPRSLSWCRGNRLLPDPSSRRVAVWESPLDIRRPIRATWPGEAVIVALLASATGEPSVKFTEISGTVRVEPLRWDAGGTRLLLRVGKSGAALWESRTLQLVEAPSFDPLFTWMILEPLSHGDTGFYRDPATLALARRIQAEGEPLRWVANPGPRRTTFLVFRPGDRLRLRAYGYGRDRNTGIPLAFASRPLLPADSTRPTFLGDQAGSSRYLPYALPIVDRRTGRVAGRFGLERLELKDGRRIDLRRVFGQLMTIQDAGANGDAVFALVNLAREKRIVRIVGTTVESWPLCEKKGIQVGPLTLPVGDTLPQGTEVTREEVFFGPAKDKAFGLLYRPGRADGRLVVWLHGGPTATLAGDTIPREVQDLAPLGISVLAVEQSGMLGGGLGLTRRLPRLGHKALLEDMRSVARWVRRSGFPRAFLIADSFGGASGVIAAVDHPQVYEHIFLRAPLLALPPPETTVDRRPMFGEENPRPENQREFEETVFGDRDRFAADLRAWTARLRPSSRLSLYFGDLDPVSGTDDLPAAFAGDPSVTIVRARHEMTANSPEVERDIVAKLGSAR